MPRYTDMMGRSIEVCEKPQRIVSVVPSQTELLYTLGLEEEVLGITRFCVHPREWFRSKQRVGGTKQLHLDRIRQLQPDLILANKEENLKAEIETLSAEFPVWISDISSLDDALTMIRQIATVCARGQAGASLATQIAAAFSALGKGTSTRTAAYFIWRGPWMTAGQDTFIHQMMHCCGFSNVYGNHSRYPQTSLEELAALAPEVILLSSEPYPFREQHIAEIRAVLPGSRVLLVDGELFSWYGSRLLHSPAYFAALRRQLSLD